MGKLFKSYLGGGTIYRCSAWYAAQSHSLLVLLPASPRSSAGRCCCRIPLINVRLSISVSAAVTWHCTMRWCRKLSRDDTAVPFCLATCQHSTAQLGPSNTEHALRRMTRHLLALFLTHSHTSVLPAPVPLPVST